jgi:hypothetical protein
MRCMDFPVQIKAPPRVARASIHPPRKISLESQKRRLIFLDLFSGLFRHGKSKVRCVAMLTLTLHGYLATPTKIHEFAKIANGE